MTPTRDDAGAVPTDVRLGERKSLELLAAFCFIDVVYAMQAALVLGAARLLFHDKQSWFSTNPANTLLAAALQALEERSVVKIAEQLKDKSGALDLPDAIKWKSDLICHRNALSHPFDVDWKGAGMAEFMRGDRHHFDLRCALVWDMYRSVNARLAELGGTPRGATIDVTTGMAIALHGILRLAMRPDAAAEHLPDERGVLASLLEFRDRYMDYVVKRVEDGRVVGRPDP